MITIPMIVKKIIRNSPFLEEELVQGIVNYSSLARKIKPEIEKELFRKIEIGAVVMALKRATKEIKGKPTIKGIFKSTPEMILRSNLFELAFSNTDSLLKKYRALLMAIGSQENYFFTVTQGVFETTVIASEVLKDKIKAAFKGEKIVAEFNNLSSITTKLPQEVIKTPGIFYFILKSLAWEGINIIEVVSTLTELTIILESKEVDKAFSILKNLF